MTYFTQPGDKGIGQPSKPFSLKKSLLGAAYRLSGPNLWAKLCISFCESRCFLGSLRTQLAKGRASRSLGPAFELDPQSQQRNKRTLARMQGIENLLAIHPWIAYQSFETFLAGFDAGEQWARDTLSSKPHPGQCEPKSTSESN
jgi:hypothetical protein